MDYKENDIELEDVEPIDLHEEEKTRHRLHRKSNFTKKVKFEKSRNKFIGRKASAYGKKMLHKYNRRNDCEASDYDKNRKFSFASILWEMS